MRTFIILCLTLFGVQVTNATHLLGGYVQVKPVVGSTLTYEISVIAYYYVSSATSEANSISLCFGDGTTGTLTRQSQQIIPLSNNGLSPGINISTYRINHTYAGPNTYTLTTSLYNRTASVNLTGSATQQEPLALTTTFSTISSVNQTPSITIPSTGFEIATNQRLVFPLRATDAEGDSLVYGLAKPLSTPSADPCKPRLLTGYQFPNDLTHQGTFKLNNRTGDLVWDAPTQQGYYSVAITVGEYRNGVLLSQTLLEIPLIAVDKPGTPAIIPPYEPAIEGSVGIVTALTEYHDEDIAFTVFPNPVDDRLQVIIQTRNSTTATLQLLDSNGRKLHQLSFYRAARQHEQVIGMGSLSPGVYLLRADIDGRSVTRKVVKK